MVYLQLKRLFVIQDCASGVRFRLIQTEYSYSLTLGFKKESQKPKMIVQLVVYQQKFQAQIDKVNTIIIVYIAHGH